MQHAVAVDAVVFVDGASGSRERAGNVALLLQDVIEFKADGGVSPEEGLGNLCIPDQFVAIHAAVAVSTAALVGEVGGDAHVPRQVDGGIGPIAEGVGLLVVAGGQLVFFDGVRQGAVHTEFQPIVAVGTVEPLVQGEVGGGIFLFDGISTTAGGQIAYVVGIIGVGEGADGELLVFQCRVDAEHAEGTPVAIDVAGGRGPSAGGFVIDAAAADAVLRHLEVGVCEDTPLLLLYIGVVEQAQAMVEGGLQVGITYLDAQGVGVVGDGQQVFHAGLAASAAVGDAQLAQFGETYA